VKPLAGTPAELFHRENKDEDLAFLRLGVKFLSSVFLIFQKKRGAFSDIFLWFTIATGICTI